MFISLSTEFISKRPDTLISPLQFPSVPTASAPGKFILFGEHAVVYGKPAIALAIDLRTEVKAERSSSFKLDGKPMRENRSFYIREIIRRWKGGPVSMEIKAGVPPSSGLGSSAALTVSMLGALRSFNYPAERESIAREAFDVEYTVQGGASPTDTSTSTLGGAVYISEKKESNFRWEMCKNRRFWNVHSIDIPDMSFVVGVTGAHSSTKDMVDRVRRVVSRSPFGKDVIEDIGRIVVEGKRALENGDLVRIGELMKENHELLSLLGVSCEDIERLIRPIKDMVYGAKLTGAGGGGSVIALTDKPEKVREILEDRGECAYIVNIDKDGLIIK